MKKGEKPVRRGHRMLRMALWITLAVVALTAIAVAVFLNLPQFGRLPDGDRYVRVQRSPNWKNGGFVNPEPTEVMTGDRSFLSALWDFLFGEYPRLRPDSPVPSEKVDIREMAQDVDWMLWLGHSSYLLHVDGRNILVDPVFGAASPVGFVNRPFEGSEPYTVDDLPDIDLLVITHDHWDHLDYNTVRALKNRVQTVVCPLGVGEHLEYWGYNPKKIMELDWYEQRETPEGIRIACAPTRHFSGRGLRRNQTLWGAFVLETSTGRIYMGGDGGYGKHLKETGRKYRGFDLAILENGQYDRDWNLIHTMPEQLAQTARDLRAKEVVTVHHGKYALARHPWDEPLLNERRAAMQDSVPLIVLEIGRPVSILTERPKQGGKK